MTEAMDSYGKDCARLVTVVMLNWRRPHNLRKIVAALRKQTVPVNIAVWDNSGSAADLRPELEHYWSSARNYRCWPRWLVASLVQTPYILILDDDLCPTANDFIETALRVSSQYPGKIVGPSGRNISSTPPHYQFWGVSAQDHDVPCHVVIGACMFFEERLLQRVPISPDQWTWRAAGDDILINYYTGFDHIVSHEMAKRLQELPTGAESLSRREGHFGIREELVKSLIAKKAPPVLPLRPHPFPEPQAIDVTLPPTPTSSSSKSDDWSDEVSAVFRELTVNVPAGITFVLISGIDWVYGDNIAGRPCLIYPSSRRDLWEVGDTQAAEELEAMMAAKAAFLVIAWPAFAWLKTRPALESWLRERFTVVFESQRLLIFRQRETP